MSNLPFKNKLKLDVVPSKAALAPEAEGMTEYPGMLTTKSGVPMLESPDGPFDSTPELAQVRIVHSIGLEMVRGSSASGEITFANIVQSVRDKDLRKKLGQLEPSSTLPASVKIVAATVGDSPAYRDMCHVKVRDSLGKVMNTPHLYKGNSKVSGDVGYPLHLLTEEGGFVLEEPPQLTDTFKHYWYINKSMLTANMYREQGHAGDYVKLPRNSDASRLMYFVLVVKNGAGSGSSDQNVTGLDKSLFEKEFADKNDEYYWRFPEYYFKEVSKLLQDKLNDVRSKSFNCQSIGVEVSSFDVFSKLLTDKASVPILLTIEIDLHLPLTRDAVDAADSAKAADGARKFETFEDSGEF